MEKIIKREDGTRYAIRVNLSLGRHTNYKMEYDVKVDKCEKGKRKFISLLNTDNHEYREQSFPEGRKAWELNLYLQHVTAEEIYQAKLEAWEQLKPTR